MAKIKISTDSTADIPHEIAREHNITVLPLTILSGDQEWCDGVDIQPEEFYPILDKAQTLPVSAQVQSVTYMELFRQTLDEGYTDLIHVTVNAKGSGTYQAGVLAKDMFFEENPQAAERLRIHLIDSTTYSMAYGIPVIEAAQMVRQGAEPEAVLAHIQEWVAHARPMFVPLDLKCVKKSGRISPAAAFVGDAIGLKPLITFEDGEAKIVAKARGQHKAIAALINTCLKERKPGSSYAIVHGYNAEALDQLREEWSKVMDIPPMMEYNVGCIISINTGPNMVGIIYRR